VIDFLVHGSVLAVLLRAGLIIGFIAIADWRVNANIPLGFLYLFPMMLVGGRLNRFRCELLREPLMLLQIR